MKSELMKRLMTTLADNDKTGSVDKSSSGTTTDNSDINANYCFAKGMGLILGVSGRKARFNVFYTPESKINLIIEISGPNGSTRTERITNQSPTTHPDATQLMAAQIMTDARNFAWTKCDFSIPLHYEIFPYKIAVSYVPLFEGEHRLNLIWQGKHLNGSPYTAKIDESYCDLTELTSPSSSMGSSSTSCYLPPNIVMNDMAGFPSYANVIRKRILKQTVLIDGEEIVIEDNAKRDKVGAARYLEVSEKLRALTKRLNSVEENDEEQQCQENTSHDTNSDINGDEANSNSVEAAELKIEVTEHSEERSDLSLPSSPPSPPPPDINFLFEELTKKVTNRLQNDPCDFERVVVQDVINDRSTSMEELFLPVQNIINQWESLSRRNSRQSSRRNSHLSTASTNGDDYKTVPPNTPL